MTARKLDIEIEQGATFAMILTYLNNSGSPVDLTGYDAHMQVRDAVGGKVFLSTSVASGHIVLTALGEIRVTISAFETANTKAVRGLYDLFLKSPGGEPTVKLLLGIATITASVTR